MKKTKRKLTAIYTIIIFVIITIFGSGFFSFKYYNELKTEYKIFKNGLNYILVNKIDPKKLISVDFFDINKEKEKINTDVLGGFNYIFISSENEKISTNLNHKIYDKDLIEYILEEDGINEIDYLGKYYVSKLKVTGGEFALLKRLEYDLEDYLEDLVLYFVISVFGSFLFYIIGYKFISKTLEPVEQNLDAMSEFVNNAGHELKHPISIAYSNIEILNNEKSFSKELNDEILEELNKMSKLIDNLSNLSNIQNQKNQEKCNILEIITDIINKYNKEINSKNIDVLINIDNNFEVYSNKYSIYILLSNLISNSIKYNKKSGKIIIKNEDNKLIIEDSGIGIFENNIKKIFDRFYQEDKSRKSEGFGIGLSLVKKIVDINKWKIRVESEKGQKTIFKIIF